MPTDELYLGIDSGGTKTEAVITSQEGTILGKGLAGGANPHNAPIGTVIDHIEAAISVAKGDLVNPTFRTICLGVAGLDTPTDFEHFKSQLESRLHPINLLLYNDGYIGLKSGTDDSQGICLIASTGSNCYGINSEGKEAKAGDWGYLLGDQGSGFQVGLSLLKLAVKESDGRKPSTGLFDQVCQEFKVNNFSELVQLIYQANPPIESISKLAHLISEPKFNQHQGITEVASYSVSSLFESFEAVIRRIGFSETEVLPVVLVGKLFLAEELITKPLSSLITTHYPQARIILPTQSPAEAAAKLARQHS